MALIAFGLNHRKLNCASVRNDVFFTGAFIRMFQNVTSISLYSNDTVSLLILGDSLQCRLTELPEVPDGWWGGGWPNIRPSVGKPSTPQLQILLPV